MQSNENLAILISDIAGFTERMSTRSREDMRRLLDWHDQTLRRVIEFYEGQWIKSTGDGVLAVFRSPTNAVQCGMAIQDEIAEYNHQQPQEEQFHVRIALNVGEVRWVGNGDISGEAVNLAARIEGETPVDEVWLSDAMYLVMNKAEVPSEKVGERTFKGIPEPVRIYRVPSGEAVRLVGTGEKMQIEGVPYPFGGMPRPAHANAKSNQNDSQVTGSHTTTGAAGSGLSGRSKVALAVGAFILILVAVLFDEESGMTGYNENETWSEQEDDADFDSMPEVGLPAPAPPPDTPRGNPSPAPTPQPTTPRALSMQALQGEWGSAEDGLHLMIQGQQYQLFEFGVPSDAGTLAVQDGVVYASSMVDGMTYPFTGSIRGVVLFLQGSDGEEYTYRRLR